MLIAAVLQLLLAIRRCASALLNEQRSIAVITACARPLLVTLSVTCIADDAITSICYLLEALSTVLSSGNIGRVTLYYRVLLTLSSTP